MNQSENIISWLGDKSRWNKQRNKQFLKVQEKNTQEILDTIKVSHLLIIGREEVKESQVNGRKQIVNKIIKGNYPKLRSTYPYRYKKYTELKWDRTESKKKKERRQPISKKHPTIYPCQNTNYTEQ